MPALKNPRQERFVQELVKGRSHREAYRLAGYTAHKGHGARLARRPEVARRYDELARIAARDAEVSAASIMRELAAIAFANITDFVTVDAGGHVQADLTNVSREQAAALVEITANAHRVRFKLADKLEALIALGRMLGLFRERVEVTAPERPPMSDFEAARRIAFIFRKAHAARGGKGEPTIEGFLQDDADVNVEAPSARR